MAQLHDRYMMTMMINNEAVIFNILRGISSYPAEFLGLKRFNNSVNFISRSMMPFNFRKGVFRIMVHIF